MIICERCKRKSDINYFIDNHPLCRNCSNEWSVFFMKHYSRIKKIERRKEEKKWHECWDNMFTQFLESVEEVVSFT